MASSSSNPHVTLEVREEYPCTYPYPLNLASASLISVKLNGREKYGIWKTQMLCLLESHGMLGFIDGTLISPETSVSGKEKVDDHHQTHYRLWRRSDALIKSLILGSLSDQTLTGVVDRLTKKLRLQINAADFSAKDVWDELQTMYAPANLPHERVVEDKQEDEERAQVYHKLFNATLKRNWRRVAQHLSTGKCTVIDKITSITGNTALHVAVTVTKNPEFLEKMLELTPENTQLSDIRNSDGSTLLHVAAIIGNTEAARILVARNRDLLLAKDNEGQTPLAIALSNMHTETAQYLLQHIDTDIEDALFSGPSGDELLVTVISLKDFRLANHLVGRYKEVHSDALLMATAQNFPCELNILERFIGS
ncbi:hypothetical protein L1887_38192 [Cichorium endivia]|nr:hypothetical protein L1887_38192 [Cichorium endivia]